jgi:hypothetical protein
MGIYVRYDTSRTSIKTCTLQNVSFRWLLIIILQYVNTLVYEMGLEEKNLEKRQKLDQLRLSREEWERLDLFANLLAVSLPL